MENTHIYVVGAGKLANAILASRSLEFKKWVNSGKISNKKSILIHAGSGRQLNECIEFCSKTKSIFIELSTGLKTEKMTSDFPLIICPNISILILKTLNMIKIFGDNFENYDISITESHQATKVTEPGTAYNIAQSLKVQEDKVISIRDSQIQKNEIGIPQEFLEKHAYHKIVIKDNKDEVTIETKALGHNSYVNGVEKIIKTCINYKLENKKYTVLDLIDHGMI